MGCKQSEETAFEERTAEFKYSMVFGFFMCKVTDFYRRNLYLEDEHEGFSNVSLFCSAPASPAYRTQEQARQIVSEIHMNLNSVFQHANSTVGNGLAGRTGAPHETNLYLKSAMTVLLSTLALFSHTSFHLLLL